MDRLTKHSSSFICNSSNCIIAKCEQCENRLPSCYEEDCNATVAIVDRLAYFEDLQEQGRLVMLPCKAGDTVFSLWSRVDSKKQYIRHAIVTVSNLIYYTRRIQEGRSFVTRDEAQVALDRMEEQK